MTASDGKGPSWLQGPSITRALCVFLIGFCLMLIAALLDWKFNGTFAGALAMAGWVVGAVAVLDFYISLFTILWNRRQNKTVVAQRSAAELHEVPGQGFRVGSHIFQTKEDAEEFLYHMNVQRELTWDKQSPKKEESQA